MNVRPKPLGGRVTSHHLHVQPSPDPQLIGGASPNLLLFPPRAMVFPDLDSAHTQGGLASILSTSEVSWFVMFGVRELYHRSDQCRSWNLYHTVCKSEEIHGLLLSALSGVVQLARAVQLSTTQSTWHNCAYCRVVPRKVLTYTVVVPWIRPDIQGGRRSLRLDTRRAGV